MPEEGGEDVTTVEAIYEHDSFHNHILQVAIVTPDKARVVFRNPRISHRQRTQMITLLNRQTNSVNLKTVQPNSYESSYLALGWKFDFQNTSIDLLLVLESSDVFGKPRLHRPEGGHRPEKQD